MKLKQPSEQNKVATSLGLSTREEINQRYVQSLQTIFKKYNFSIGQCGNSKTKSDDSLTFQIQQSELIKSRQTQFYYCLLKDFYDIRKILQPQITFQAFLSQYRNQINQKLNNYGIDHCIEENNLPNNLNLLMMQNELRIRKSEIIQKCKNKQNQISILQNQSEQLNSEYNELIKSLVSTNTTLSVENIELQLELKLKEAKKKESLTKTYLPSRNSKETKQNKISTQFQKYKEKVPSIKNERKQQIERIKTVVKNNMWGWGDQILQRLNKLKTLKKELNST